MDIVDRKTRSRMMSGIGSKNTKPEMIVRRYLHAQGFRFRLHIKDLPGKPDVVLPKHRVCVLVHGCYWHRHPGCKYASIPKSNADFWQNKFQSNVARDVRNEDALRLQGWYSIVIWECDTRNETALLNLKKAILQASLWHSG